MLRAQESESKFDVRVPASALNGAVQPLPRLNYNIEETKLIICRRLTKQHDVYIMITVVDINTIYCL
jgi:hypothetical protein